MATMRQLLPPSSILRQETFREELRDFLPGAYGDALICRNCSGPVAGATLDAQIR